MNTNVYAKKRATKKAATDIDTSIPISEVMPKRMYGLRDRTVIVEGRLSRFGNSKADIEVKYEVAKDKGADYEMVSFSKKLLPPDIMSAVQKHYSRARDLFRIPKSASNGVQKYEPMRFGIAQWHKGQVLVNTSRLSDLLNAFAGCKADMAAELEKLRPKWKDIMTEAMAKTGKLFDIDLMPTFDDFADSWDMNIIITALPEYDPVITLDNDQLMDVINQVKNDTANRLTRQLSESWSAAAQSMLQSLEYTTAVLGNDADVVQRMNGTKGKRKSDRAVPIADTLFDNLRNQLATTRSLFEAAADDEGLGMVDKAIDAFKDMTAEHLRKNPSDRKRVAAVSKKLVREAKRTVTKTEANITSALDELADFA